MPEDFYPGFEIHDIDVAGVSIHLRKGGNGPPLLLLHGYPQTHIMWHKIAPRLAEDFTLVIPDLRGYGESSKPEGDDEHRTYSKREMALDQAGVMTKLGFDRFSLVGHDRGARVSHRLALDHADRIERLALLDIVPTRDVYLDVDKLVATAYFHWFFLIQKRDLPERLIGGAPDYFFNRIFDGGSGGRANEVFGEAAIAEYLRCHRTAESIHATCEDYRAGASIDLQHDEADLDTRIFCPVHLIWGARGLVGLRYHVLDLWKKRASLVTGEALENAGHFLAEEAPDETYRSLIAFLKGSGG